MAEEKRRENRASEDFQCYQEEMIGEKKRRFVNMREALIDVLVTIEREHDERFAKKLKRRTVDARSEEELRFIMDGMLVIAGFVVRPSG